MCVKLRAFPEYPSPRAPKFVTGLQGNINKIANLLKAKSCEGVVLEEGIIDGTRAVWEMYEREKMKKALIELNKVLNAIGSWL